MPTYYDPYSTSTSSYRGTDSTQYYTYSNSVGLYVKIQDDLKKTSRREAVLQKLQSTPVFKTLFELGAFNNMCSIWASEDHFKKLLDMFGRPEFSHLMVSIVNTTKEKLFFKSVAAGRLVIIIYGIFDADATTLTKTNFIKKADYLLSSGGALILLSDKEHPDTLRDLLSVVGTDWIKRVEPLTIPDTVTRGLIVKKV